MRDNKRNVAQRLKKRVEVRYGKEEPAYTGYSGNLSTSGMMIRSTRVFGPGTILKVEVKTQDRTFLLDVRVEWARSGSIQLLQTGRVGMGVRFLEPPDEFIAWLEGGQRRASKAG